MAITITENNGTATVSGISLGSSPDTVTIPGGGKLVLDDEIKEIVGEGPYTINFASDGNSTDGTINEVSAITLSGNNGSILLSTGGGGLINNMENATIEGGDNVTVETNTEDYKIIVSAATPTAEDIGALPITGGDLNGSLDVQGGLLVDPQDGSHPRIYLGSGTGTYIQGHHTQSTMALVASNIMFRTTKG